MKKSLGAKTLLFPTPVLIIGTYDEKGVPNAMNVAWGGIASSEPPCVTISVREQRKTYQNILANDFTNPTVQQAVDDALTAVLGREAAARGKELTMEEIIAENQELAFDTTGLKV